MKIWSSEKNAWKRSQDYYKCDKLLLRAIKKDVFKTLLLAPFLFDSHLQLDIGLLKLP